MCNLLTAAVVLGVILLICVIYKNGQSKEGLLVRCNHKVCNKCPTNSCHMNAGECCSITSDLHGRRFRSVDMTGTYSPPAVIRALEDTL